MDYFNYFIKQLIRIFTRKFFWILIVGVLLFLSFVVFSTDVNAQSIYTIDDSIFNENDVQKAHILLGDEIWTDDNYDIILGYMGNWSLWYGGGFDYGKAVFVVSNNQGASSYYLQTPYNEITGGSRYQTTFSFPLNEYPTDLSSFTAFRQALYLNNVKDVFNNSNFSVISQPEGYNQTTIWLKSIRNKLPIYDTNNNLLLGSTNVKPYIVNGSTVDTWSFDYLYISPGSYDIQNSTCNLDIDVNGVLYSIGLNQYYNSDHGLFIIPRNQLSNYFVVRNEDVVNFYFSYRLPVEYGGIVSYDNLGNYTLSLNATEQENINQDSEKQVQGEILEENKKTNEKLDNIENTITDSSIPDNISNDLPKDNTEDITKSGIDGLFTNIYNAFCEGEAQDIVLPIPYTNKSITISPNYLSDMLTSVNATFLITIIQAFWWYLISRFIVKDIMGKINKIKSGNIEDIETENIKGDML